MRRYALLVGCNTGRNQRALNHAQGDVRRVQQMLLRHAGWTDEQIITVVGDVTFNNVEDGVGCIRSQLKDNDFVLVYYAGHAGTFNGAYSLILPHEYYPVRNFIEPFITANKLSGSLLVLDTCYSERASVSAFQGFLRLITKRPDHMDQIQGIKGVRAVFAASAANQTARERSSGGILTSAFLLGCEAAGRDLSASVSGTVTLDSLSGYIQRELADKGQDFKAFTYGGSFDIKSRLDWRLRSGSSREYRQGSFIMLPEQTRNWYRISHDDELLSSHWSGNPLVIGVGVNGYRVQLYKVDLLQRRVEKSRELPVIARGQGIRMTQDAQHVVVCPAADDSVQVYAVESGGRLRDYAVNPDQFVITSHNMLVTHNSSSGLIEAWPILNRNQAVAMGSYPPGYKLRHMRAFPDGMRVVAGGSADGKARVWTLTQVLLTARNIQSMPSQTLECERLDSLSEAFLEVRKVAVSSSGEMIGVGFGGTGRVRVWLSREYSRPMSGVVFAQHGDYITALDFDTEDTWLASGCGGGKVYLTSLREKTNPRLIWEADRGTSPGERISALAFSRHSADPILAIGTTRGRVIVCGIGQHNSGARLELGEHEARGTVQSLGVFTRDNQPPQIVVSAQRALECWDFAW